MPTADRWFRPLKRDARIKEILAFDVEGTGGEDGFVCGAITGVYTSEFYTDRDAMWQSILMYGSQGIWVWSHNLEYDLPIVAGADLWSGELTFKTNGMLWAKYVRAGRKLTLYDSMNLFPRMSVSDLGKIAGMPKLAVRKDILYRLSHGVPWRDFSPVDQREIERYCLRDAEVVHKCVTMLQEELNLMGGELRGTLASCSMDLYRRTYHKYPWQALGPQANALVRPGYYGGRVEPFAMGQVENVNLYDINSLYPAVQREESFPHPGSLQLVTGRQALAAIDHWHGIAQVKITVPETYIPPLPRRVQRRLYFPTGSFGGHWTLSEIRAAVGRGATLNAVEWVLGASVTFNPFERFIDDLYKKRQGYLVADDQRQEIIKLLMNSLYGRFGLNPDNGLVRMIRYPDDADKNALPGYITADKDGVLVAYGPVEGMRFPSYVNVLFAAQISAAGRLKLLTELEKHGEAALYCDTDSLMTLGSVETGDGLGEWKAQMQHGRADLIGAKEYVLHNEANQAKWVVKGVPEDVAAQYILNGHARYRRAVKVREAIRRGLDPSEWVQTFREARPSLPKRRPSIYSLDQEIDFTLTIPWEFRQLVKMSQQPSEWSAQQQLDREPKRLPEWVRAEAARLEVPAEMLVLPPQSLF